MPKNKILAVLAAMGLSIGAIFAGSLIVPDNEGLVTHAYVDPVGILTSCYGHTGPDVQAGRQYSNQECVKQLGADLQEKDRAVHATITVPLTWYQEAALIAFAYNVGEGNLRKSTLAKMFNAKRYTEGCKQMLRWVYAGGKKLPGLVKVRQRETEVCLGNVTLVKAQ